MCRKKCRTSVEQVQNNGSKNLDMDDLQTYLTFIQEERNSFNS